MRFHLAHRRREFVGDLFGKKGAAKRERVVTPGADAGNDAGMKEGEAAETRVASTAPRGAKADAEGASKRPEPKLTDEMRAFVVVQNASFVPPRTVAAAVKEHWGVEITPQAVEAYDPTKVAGSGLSERWKGVFAEARKRAIDEDADIGVAHRNVRLAALDRMARKAEGQGNLVTAAALLEQAAKEKGDLFTNARVLRGAGANGGHVVDGLAELLSLVDGGTRHLKPASPGA